MMSASTSAFVKHRAGDATRALAVAVAVTGALELAEAVGTAVALPATTVCVGLEWTGTVWALSHPTAARSNVVGQTKRAVMGGSME